MRSGRESRVSLADAHSSMCRAIRAITGPTYKDISGMRPKVAKMRVSTRANMAPEEAGSVCIDTCRTCM